MDNCLGQPIAAVRNTLLGLEGSAAKRYWAAVGTALPQPWQFEGRSRRPARDVFNAVLNYYYGMLYNVVENAALAAGLDPYLGFFHVDAYKRPVLVFDLIEPFRPWVDRLLVELCLSKPFLASHFTTKENGLLLSKEGRINYIPRFNDYFEERITYKGQRLSRKNHIHYFTGQLAQWLLHEADLPGQL